MNIKPGQVWKENDNRFKRQVRVLGIEGIWVTVENIETKRKATNHIERFNGKRGGFSLLEDASGDSGQAITEANANC